MSGTAAPKQSSILPQRRFLPAQMQPSLDKLGFLRVDSLDESMGVEDLLSRNTTLILGSPWLGKTFVAKRVDVYLNSKHGKSSYGFDGRVVRLAARELSPPISAPFWWSEWANSSNRACVVFDGIDEDFPSCKTVYSFLALLETLTAEQRSRLCLLLFSRPNELPDDFEEKLEKIHSPNPDERPVGYQVVRLAPLDQESARDFLGSSSTFTRICGLLDRNKLRQFGGYPTVLNTLQHLDSEATYTSEDIWEEVIKDMLRDRRGEKAMESGLRVDDAFDACCHIAAALTFSGFDELNGPGSLNLSRQAELMNWGR